MNRSTTENSRRLCAFLAAGLIATLSGCGSHKANTASAESLDDPEAASVGEVTPVADGMSETASDTKMAASPDGTMMPVLQTLTTPDGLVIEDLKVGDGKEAAPGSTIVIHYQGTLTDGTIIDSTRGAPAYQHALNELIQGWRQGIPGMRVGGIRRLTVPPELAYGTKGKPQAGIPSNATLTYSIQLVDVVGSTNADAGQ